jgi:hypothetical protein
MEKIVVFAPIASASETAATSVNPGLLRSRRAANTSSGGNTAGIATRGPSNLAYDSDTMAWCSVLCATLVVATAACDGAAGPSSITRVPNGTWGDQHERLTVSSNGSSFDGFCAHGSIEQPMMVDQSGHFDVPGTFLQQVGGPSIGVSHAARYVGSADGRILNLTVQFTDSPQTVGPFVLTLGQSPTIAGCSLV